MKNPFYIGDRVRAIDHIRSGATNRVVGLAGTIICHRMGNPNMFGVDFDTDFGGHSCDNKVRHGHGQWMHYIDLEFEGSIVELTGDIESLF